MGRTIAVVFPDWETDHGQFGQHHSGRVFESFIRRIEQISAVVEIEKIGTVVMSARGPSRYFGGDHCVALKLHEMFYSNENAVGVGIADSRFAALAAAHLSALRRSPCVIDSGITLDFLDALSVRALVEVGNIDEETIDLLMRLGVYTCGGVRKLGEVALIDRFGVVGHRIFQLVSAHDVHSFAIDTSSSDFSRVYESETPLTSVPHVVASVRAIAEEVIETVSSAGQQCIRLYIHCETEHGESVSRIWGESGGFTTAALLQRLSYQLEAWYVGNGETPEHCEAPTSGVVRVFIKPMECRNVLATQSVLWGGYEENTERAARAVSQALAVADNVRISVPQWNGGRDICNVYSQVPITTVDITSLRNSSARVGIGERRVKKWTGTLPRPWPAWLAPSAVNISVLDANNCHVGVTGRHELTSMPAYVLVGQRKYVVDKVAGPWPLEERWWDTHRLRRNVRLQLMVRNEHNAGRVFLVLLESNAWKLVGRYD